MTVKPKLIISGKLETRTALHIGSGQSSSEADALLHRNAAGEIVIPGSALAGALRALATRLAPRLGSKLCQALEPASAGTACGCAVCHLFGDVEPQAENVEESGGRAARLWVYDAQWLPPEAASNSQSPLTWVRDGVGIDRSTGAAARLESVKFDLEVLSAGAVFDLRLELEDASDQDEQLLAAALAEWQAGRAWMGGRVARGLGAAELTSLECQRRDLNDPDALMAFLRSNKPLVGQPESNWLADALKKAQANLHASECHPCVACSWVEIEFTLQAHGPFLVNDPTVAGLSGFDHAPLVEWRQVMEKDTSGQNVTAIKRRPVLPGASLRGVLRSQAERIARTLATQKAKDKNDFLLHCPACSPVARPAQQGETVALQCCDALLEDVIRTDQETEPQDVCLACQLFGSARLGSRLIVEDAPLASGVEPEYKVMDFLAIDRFTGGGKEGAKFDAAALWNPAFSARLRLENPHAWELGWLALVLRDLAEGWLTVGFGRAKGFGQITIPRWTATIGYIQPADFPAAEALLSPLQDSQSLYSIVQVEGQVNKQPDRKFKWQLDKADEPAWLKELQTWVEKFTAEMAAFPRTRSKRLEAWEKGTPNQPEWQDSYFGVVDTLYPKSTEVRHA